MSAVTVTSSVNLTPALMAKAFWSMPSDQQSGFFAELAKVIQDDHKTNRNAYSLGELQWCYVGEELEKQPNKLAREMLMTMAAPLYLHTLHFTESKAA